MLDKYYVLEGGNEFLREGSGPEGDGVSSDFSAKKSTICERPNSPNLLAPRAADAGAVPVSDGPYGFLKACSEFEGIQLLQRRGGLY